MSPAEHELLAPHGVPILRTETDVDDGDAVYGSTGLSHCDGPDYFQNDVDYAAAGNGSGVAMWMFSRLVPSEYRVSTTWPGHVNLATNAAYSVFDGSKALGTVDVNQGWAPDHLADAESC